MATFTITWDAPTTHTDGTPVVAGEILGYVVQEGGQQISTETITGTSFVTGEYPAGTYNFDVIALDTNNALNSAASAPASGTVPPAPLSAPTGVTVTLNPGT